MSLYPPPRELATSVYVDLVAAMGWKPRLSPQRAPAVPVHSLLEGPSFDREGNLYVTNPPFGEVLRIRPDRTAELAAAYDGRPVGLKIHRSGEIFIADKLNGIMRLDPVSRKVTPFLPRERLGPGYKGVNDLVFAADGDLYFTDQGDTDVRDPTGRVFRLRVDGRLDLLLDNVPHPNGIVLNPAEDRLFIAATYGPAVWHCALLEDGSIGRTGIFQTFNGGFGGPDGLAMNTSGGLAVCHHRLGTVWTFTPAGEPEFRIRSCRGAFTTNLAYGGPDRRLLYITESEQGVILQVELPTPGQAMFSHRS